ncbi:MULTISPECIES: ribonuclease T2 family protein, partial [Corallococcus]
MRIPPRLALCLCLLIVQGCRTRPETPPPPPPAAKTATVRPLDQATAEALDIEFGRPQATACNCFADEPSAPDGGACATPRFGAYLLALTWAPNFCPGHPDKEQCAQLAGSFAANHLTIHGLWPQFNDEEAKQQRCTYPAFCGGLCECQGPNAPSRCFPDPSTIPDTMGTYGPGYVTDNFFLANHEWPKHGSCTGMDARSYFTSSIDALLSLPGDQGTPELLRDNVGRGVPLSDLRSAFGAVDSVVLRCDSRCNLAEVGVCFGVGDQGKPTPRIPCPRNVTDSTSNSCVGDPERPRCPTVSLQA